MNHNIARQMPLNETRKDPYLSNKEIINKVLENYFQEFRFVKSFIADEATCDAEVLVDSYPYAGESAFSYVTSTSISLLLSQVSYIFIANLIINYNHKFLDGIDLQTFLKMRDNGNLLFTRNNFEFRKKIPKKVAFKFKMRLLLSKRLRDFVCGKFSFEVPGYLVGDAMLVAGPLSNMT